MSKEYDEARNFELNRLLDRCKELGYTKHRLTNGLREISSHKKAINWLKFLIQNKLKAVIE